jgi:hypothetical protein
MLAQCTTIQQKSTATQDLTVTQVQVLAALISGCTVTGAAERAGVDRSTIYHWLRRSPMFVAELNRAKREALESAQQSVQMLSGDAVAALRAILTAESTPASVRLKAAMAILDGLGAMRTQAAAEIHPEDVQFGWTRDARAKERKIRILGR